MSSFAHAHAALPVICFQPSCGRGTDGDAAHPESTTAPWVLVVRWWWLRGIRARQAGHADEALACFRRCEKALKGGGKRRRRRRRYQAESSGGSGAENDDKSGEEQEDEDHEAVVLLPYCAVHPRIDLQVCIGACRRYDAQPVYLGATDCACTGAQQRSYSTS